ncbi:MAG: HdeD family acid-resistance protein [Akkermansiaceae bacterium]
MSQSIEKGEVARSLASAALGVAWWYFLLRGLAFVIAGLFLLFKPGMSATVFTQVIGAFILIDGILAIVAGFTGASISRMSSIVRGVVAVLVGWLIFSRPALIAGFAVSTLLYIIAAVVLVGGVIEIKAAFNGTVRKSRQPSLIVGGLLVAFGLLLLFAPLTFGLLIMRIIGGVALMIGVVLLVLAFRSRKLRGILE